MNRLLAKAYLLLALSEHLNSNESFRTYWKNHSIKHLKATANHLQFMDLDRETVNNYRAVINIIQRKRAGKRIPKSLRKVPYEILLEKIRGQLIKNQIAEQLKRYIHNNQVVLFEHLFKTLQSIPEEKF